MPTPSSAPPTLQIRLGLAVRRLRVAAGYSQEAFADHAGLHRTYQSLLERGHVAATVVTLEKVASALALRVSELLAEAERGEESSRRAD